MEIEGKTFSQKVLVWAINYVEQVLILTILSLGSFLLSLYLLFIYGFDVCLFLVFGFSIFPALIFYYLHAKAKRYREVIDALGLDIVKVEFNENGVLKFSSPKYGAFYLHYFTGAEREEAYYQVWILSDKSGRFINKSGDTLYKKPSFFHRLLDKPVKVPYCVPKSQVIEIKSLLEIKIEPFGEKYRLIGILDDKWMYSETPDILRTLEVLESIWVKL